MSIVDFTTGLFRDSANARAFAHDPAQALRDAGLPDARPEQIHALFPVVAESMPPDHPLQEAARSADIQGTLNSLFSGAEGGPADGDPTTGDSGAAGGEEELLLQSTQIGKWELIDNDAAVPATEFSPSESEGGQTGADDSALESMKIGKWELFADDQGNDAAGTGGDGVIDSGSEAEVLFQPHRLIVPDDIAYTLPAPTENEGDWPEPPQTLEPAVPFTLEVENVSPGEPDYAGDDQPVEDTAPETEFQGGAEGVAFEPY